MCVLGLMQKENCSSSSPWIKGQPLKNIASFYRNRNVFYFIQATCVSALLILIFSLILFLCIIRRKKLRSKLNRKDEFPLKNGHLIANGAAEPLYIHPKKNKTSCSSANGSINVDESLLEKLSLGNTRQASLCRRHDQLSLVHMPCSFTTGSGNQSEKNSLIHSPVMFTSPECSLAHFLPYTSSGHFETPSLIGDRLSYATNSNMKVNNPNQVASKTFAMYSPMNNNSNTISSLNGNDLLFKVDKLHDHAYMQLKPLNGELFFDEILEHVSNTLSHYQYKQLIRYEYDQLNKGSHFQQEVALQADNFCKNRQMVAGKVVHVPYDYNRVRLLKPMSSDVVSDDYINASYINGYGGVRNRYIAAQSPLANEVFTFWRMIWQQHVELIVIPCEYNCGNGLNDCAGYWPSIKTPLFIESDQLQISLISLNLFSFSRVYNFEIRHSSGVKRSIWQYEYTLWNYDSEDVPKFSLTFIMFYNQISREKFDSSHPILVHCPTGSGPTATLIVFDFEMDRLDKEKRINVFSTCEEMRNQRCFMLEHVDQFEYVFRVIHDVCLMNANTVSRKFAINGVKRISPRKCCFSIANFVTEWHQEEGRFSPATNGNSNIMSAPYVYALYEYLRSYMSLSTQNKSGMTEILADKLVVEGSSFSLNYNSVRLAAASPNLTNLECATINASYIDGYCIKGEYIVTQHPTYETANDFWRMIWETNCLLIIVLVLPCQLKEEDLFNYWPLKNLTLFHSSLRIENIHEYDMESYIMRELKITNTLTSDSRIIRQFQAGKWPCNLSDVDGIQAIICLIVEMFKTKHQFGIIGPVTVHCSNATDRSAVYLASANTIEQSNYEEFIDLYMNTRYLIIQRPNIMRNPAAFHLCHLVMAQYFSNNF